MTMFLFDVTNVIKGVMYGSILVTTCLIAFM